MWGPWLGQRVSRAVRHVRLGYRHVVPALVGVMGYGPGRGLGQAGSGTCGWEASRLGVTDETNTTAYHHTDTTRTGGLVCPHSHLCTTEYCHGCPAIGYHRDMEQPQL